jgi:nucleotide-binding universal stress UspA family protein
MATTDFSDESLIGVRYALKLAGKLSAEVALLHVVELPARIGGREAVPFAGGYSDIAAHALARLEAIGRTLGEGDLGRTCLIRRGKPFYEITAAAREASADLIVMATHGYTGAKRVLLGSTAERVVRHAKCPVLTVPTGGAAPAGPSSLLSVRRILVPIDFSRVSRSALPWARLLATQFDAEIVLLHVMEKYPMDYLLGAELMNETLTPLLKEAEANLGRLAGGLRKASGLKASGVVRDGTPFEEICHAAKALPAELIVLTTRGFTGLKHVWVGSTAERVVRHAPCPVLAVRERLGRTAR